MQAISNLVIRRDGKQGRPEAEDYRAQKEFTFSVLQTPASMFKVHYDLVTL
jgi:hypothetical protein